MTYTVATQLFIVKTAFYSRQDKFSEDSENRWSYSRWPASGWGRVHRKLKREFHRMDIEFHYYMTYLIAARAGFSPDDARRIAYSSQFVDDNDVIYTVSKDSADEFTNYISQTMNILKPKPKLLRIYPLFHFIPGDAEAATARRKDGKQHLLNTTPNSENANRIIDGALASGCLYRLGIASHAYVDTWAHQNFIGYYDDFNGMKGPLNEVKPDIGHADAEHNPDWPALVWKDPRLLSSIERVDNKERFLEAARHLFLKYVSVTEAYDEDGAAATANDLCQDLGDDIGERDQTNDKKAARIERYKRRAESAEYGDTELPDFDEDHWFDDAINEDVRGLRDRSQALGAFLRIDPFADKYTWRRGADYEQTDWYRFQVAVKAHQDSAWEILEESTFSKMELSSL